MTNRWLFTLAAGALLLAPVAALADVGNVYGLPSNPTCDAAVGRPNDTNTNLFAFHSGSISDKDDIIGDVKGGTVKWGGPSFNNGIWFILRNNFVPAPGATEVVWVVSTSMDTAALGTHQGFMTVDHYVATAGAGHNEVMQPLAWAGAPTPNPAGGYAQGGSTGKATGYDLRWTPLGEFDTTPSGPNNCFSGGPATPSFANRLIAGYNVYRVQGIAPATSTPADYKAGWVGYLSLNPTGGAIDLDAGTDLNTMNDLFGVEAGSLIFSDALKLPNGTLNAKAPANINGADGTWGNADDPVYTYAFQPVVRTTVPLASFNGGTGVTDSDADTRPDSVDLNADTVPEFFDPSGTGLGLMYQGAAGGSYILLSTDSAATDAGAALPSAGDIQFSASFTGGVFSLNFTAALETSIAGYNVFRSAAPNDSSSFVQVNKGLIMAKGAPLSVYAYQDAVPLTRRMARGVYYYKVEAVYLDGSRKSYGPYEASFAGTSSERGR